MNEREAKDGFSNWLFDKSSPVRRLVAVVGSIAVFIVTAKSLIDLLPHGTATAIREHLRAVLLWLQIIVILALALLIRSPRASTSSDPDIKRAHKTVRQFVRSWRAAWLLYLAVYGFWVLGSISRLGDQSWLPALQHLALNGQTLQLFGCYYILTWPSLGQDDETSEVPLHSGWGLVGILALVEGLILVIPDPGVHDAAVLAFSLVSGFAATIALALLAGRFESKLVGSNTGSIVIIYSYAALQTTVALFGDKALPIMNLAIAIALPFKVFLFLFIHWIVTSGRLVFYMARIHRLDAHVDGDWLEFRTKL